MFFHLQTATERRSTASRPTPGVKRSRDSWFGRIRNLFASRELDDSVWDEIEEILISADVSVETTMTVLDDLRADVRAGRITDGEGAFSRLKDLLAAELAADDDPDAWSDDESIAPPYVILVCGVNGVGENHQHRQAGPSLHWVGQEGDSGRRRHFPRRRGRTVGNPRRAGRG